MASIDASPDNPEDLENPDNQGEKIIKSDKGPLTSTKYSEDDQNKPSEPLASATDVFLLGITAVIGGECYGWNTQLVSGFGMYILAQILVGTAYICLVACIAEISSAIPFSGGAFGLSRVVLGFYPGFLVGSFEFLEYVVFTSLSVFYLGEVLCSGTYEALQPLIWLVIYAIFLMILLPGGRWMWSWIDLLGVISLGFIVIYCLGCLKWVDLGKYGSLGNTEAPGHEAQNWFAGGMVAFLSLISTGPTAAYAGIESLALSASAMRDPKKNLPIAAVAAVSVLFATNMFMTCVVSGMPPGIASTANAAYPMSVGFSLMFGTSSNVSNALIWPAQFAMAIGFVMPYGKLLHSMAQSNLAPSALMLRSQKDHRLAMMWGSLLGYLFCWLGYSVPNTNLNSIALLAAFLTYYSNLYGYYLLQSKYSSLERSFKSPFGVAGAVYAGVVFALCIISIVLFQGEEGHITVYIVMGYVVVLTIYYFAFAQDGQTLSDDEQNTMFRLRVLNFNLRVHQSMIHKHGSVWGRAWRLIFSRSEQVYIEGSSHSSSSTDRRPSVTEIANRERRMKKQAVSASGAGGMSEIEISSSTSISNFPTLGDDDSQQLSLARMGPKGELGELGDLLDGSITYASKTADDFFVDDSVRIKPIDISLDPL